MDEVEKWLLEMDILLEMSGIENNKLISFLEAIEKQLKINKENDEKDKNAK